PASLPKIRAQWRRGWRRGPLPARSIPFLGARGLVSRWGSSRRADVGPQMRAPGAGPGDRTRAGSAAPAQPPGSGGGPDQTDRVAQRELGPTGLRGWLIATDRRT